MTTIPNLAPETKNLGEKMKRRQKTMNKISFDINNGMTLEFVQREHDSNVLVHKIDHNGKKVYGNTIPNGQFVMLYNLYQYVIDNDIQNDFINPYGKNKEVL